MRIYIYAVCLLLSSNIFSQDKIYMMNGGVFNVKITDTTKTQVTLDFDKNSKTKKIVIDKEDIFSIKYGNEKEIILYTQDSLSEENYMTQQEMSDYVAGQRDAVKGYRSLGTTIGSFVVGAASGLTGGFILIPLFSPIPPSIFVVAAGARWIKIKRKNVSEPRYLKSDTYVMGYDHAARGKRLQNALIGGGSGLAAGIIGSILYSSYNKK